MGSQCARACAQVGYQVIVSEIDDAKLNKGTEIIKSRLAKNVKEGKISSQDRALILPRIKGTTDIQDFTECDIVVENIT